MVAFPSLKMRYLIGCPLSRQSGSNRSCLAGKYGKNARSAIMAGRPVFGVEEVARSLRGGTLAPIAGALGLCCATSAAAAAAGAKQSGHPSRILCPLYSLAGWYMGLGLELTPSLKVALAELYYKEFCDQQGWAYVPLRDINFKNGNNNILIFSKGPRRISVRLMDKIVPEIREISRPLDNGNFFVFDYLACRVGQQEKYEGEMLASPAALCWVKIGKSAFSNGQIDALERIKLPLLFSG